MRKIFYKLPLLLLSFILITSSFATSSMACCCIMGEGEVSADVKKMPCHDEMAEVETDAHDNHEDEPQQSDCNACDCVTCVKTSFLNNEFESKTISFSTIKFFEDDAVYSNIYHSFYQPPKQIS